MNGKCECFSTNCLAGSCHFLTGEVESDVESSMSRCAFGCEKGCRGITVCYPDVHKAADADGVMVDTAIAQSVRSFCTLPCCSFLAPPLPICSTPPLLLT